MNWRILADDLTGALDTVAVAAGGAPVPVAWDVPPSNDAPLAALATDTRDAPVDSLARSLAGACEWLAGAGLPYKKVDSLLRGNTFAELACLLHGQGRLRRILFAPALPSQGRFTAGGRHWGPRGDACASLEQAFSAVGLRARHGDTLADCGDAEVMIPAVRSDADLDTLAAHAARPGNEDWLWVGSAGLAAALRRRTREPATQTAPKFARIEGPLVLITSTRHEVTRGQLRVLRERSANVRVADWSAAQELPPLQARTLLAEHAQRTLDELPRPDTIAVVGGDTLLALCRASGAAHLMASPSPRAGWGRARLCGGAWDGVTCYSRSGAFGAPDDILELTRQLIIE